MHSATYPSASSSVTPGLPTVNLKLISNSVLRSLGAGGLLRATLFLITCLLLRILHPVSGGVEPQSTARSSGTKYFRTVKIKPRQPNPTLSAVVRVWPKPFAKFLKQLIQLIPHDQPPFYSRNSTPSYLSLPSCLCAVRDTPARRLLHSQAKAYLQGIYSL